MAGGAFALDQLGGAYLRGVKRLMRSSHAFLVSE